MTSSRIEWTQVTWNPITGCSKVSPGCTHCYAERLSKRLKAMGLEEYKNGFQLTLHEDTLESPLSWKKPRLIFVNSMSDLFHEQVPLEFILKVFDTMRRASWHQFQVLTKRSHRLLELTEHIDWPKNVWMGVTVEQQDFSFRIEDLKQTKAYIKFLSLEPLLGPITRMNLEKIDWVIAGGESGPGARPLLEEWIVNIRDECLVSGTPFFFKQWGGTNKKKNGRLLQGHLWNEMPTINNH